MEDEIQPREVIGTDGLDKRRTKKKKKKKKWARPPPNENAGPNRVIQYKIRKEKQLLQFSVRSQRAANRFFFSRLDHPTVKKRPSVFFFFFFLLPTFSQPMGAGRSRLYPEQGEIEAEGWWTRDRIVQFFSFFFFFWTILKRPRSSQLVSIWRNFGFYSFRGISLDSAITWKTLAGWEYWLTLSLGSCSYSVERELEASTFYFTQTM